MNEITTLFKALLDALASGSVDQEWALAQLENYASVNHAELECDELMARFDIVRSKAAGNSWQTVYKGDPQFDTAVPWNDPS